MNFRFRDLRIAVRLALLGLVMLAATLIVGFGGWRGLARIHDLQVRSAQTTAMFASAVDTARVAQVDFKKQVQEWKDLLLRGADTASFTKYHDAFVEQNNTVNADLAALKEQMTQLGIDTKGVDTAIATHAELGTQYLAAIQHYDSHDEKSVHVVDSMVAGIDRAPTAAIDNLVATMKRDAMTASRHIDDESSVAYRDACVLLVSVALCAIAAGATLIWLPRRNRQAFDGPRRDERTAATCRKHHSQWHDRNFHIDAANRQRKPGPIRAHQRASCCAGRNGRIDAGVYR
jgi:methyl-accepting chemotaxis protein-1 (serine sensor receptor)